MIGETTCPLCGKIITVFNHGAGIRFQYHENESNSCPAGGEKVQDFQPPQPERPKKPTINLWANFLEHEKLSPDRVGEENVMVLVGLCEELSKQHGAPKAFASYPSRIKARKLVVNTAMNMGIDLPAIKHKGKTAMSRGMLDVWNSEYRLRFGSAVGTAAAMEAVRRDVKMRLAQEIRRERNDQGIV